MRIKLLRECTISATHYAKGAFVTVNDALAVRLMEQGRATFAPQIAEAKGQRETAQTQEPTQSEAQKDAMPEKEASDDAAAKAKSAKSTKAKSGERGTSEGGI